MHARTHERTSIQSITVTPTRVPLLLPRSLAVLVRRVQEPRVLDLVRGLCDKVITVSKKDENRDIASIGLKTVIEVASGSTAHQVAALISSKMLEGVQQKVRLRVTFGICSYLLKYLWFADTDVVPRGVYMLCVCLTEGFTTGACMRL